MSCKTNYCYSLYLAIGCTYYDDKWDMIEYRSSNDQYICSVYSICVLNSFRGWHFHVSKKIYWGVRTKKLHKMRLKNSLFFLKLTLIFQQKLSLLNGCYTSLLCFHLGLGIYDWVGELCSGCKLMDGNYLPLFGGRSIHDLQLYIR